MKKYIIILVVGILLTGCYDQFRRNYKYQTVAFSNANGGSGKSGVLYRTVVKGEGLELNYGVYLAGVINNEKKRWVKFEIDPSLLNGTPYKLMPKDYYTLSNNNKFIIPKGKFIGKVTIKLDSTKFVNDPHAVKPYYAIPFRLTSTSVDSILATQDTKIVVIKYINRFTGFYNQTGSFTTYNSSGTQINKGTIDNVIHAETVMLNTVRTNGLGNQKGANYMMDITVSQISNNNVTGSTASSANSAISASSVTGNVNVSLKYHPNPKPPQVTNIAVIPSTKVSTSHVSPWETLNAINDGAPVSSSADLPRYGNWPAGTTWQWVQYNFGNTYKISKIRVYWGSDGGGLQPPTDSYVQYKDLKTGKLVKIPNSTVPNALNTFNTFVFPSPITTSTLRLNMILGSGPGAGTAIVEWQVFGMPAPVTPEQAKIKNIATANKASKYNASKSIFNLNYRINYVNGNYTIVNTKMVWRNRIRDGVNEWRR